MKFVITLIFFVGLLYRKGIPLANYFLYSAH